MKSRHNLSLVLLCFSLLLAVFAPAAAQDAHPLPQPAPNSIEIMAIPSPKSPVDGASLIPKGWLVWSHFGTSEYTIKFKIKETGEIIKWKPGGLAACAGLECKAYVPYEVMIAATHGQTLKWKVISNFDGVKSKSHNARATIDEGPAPVLVSPSDGAYTSSFYLEYLEWAGVWKGLYYTVHVVNAAGIDVINVKYSALTMCGFSYQDCSLWMNPQLQSKLTIGQTYSWYVETSTETEAVITSPVWTFVYG
jgi:hypothetical protein